MSTSFASVAMGVSMLFGLNATGVSASVQSSAGSVVPATVHGSHNEATKGSSPANQASPSRPAAATADLSESNRIDGYINTSGTTIYDEAGNAVRFFGVDSASFGYGPPTATCSTDNWTPITVTEIGDEAQWGFNVVRIALSWADLEPSPPTSTGTGLVHNWNMAYLDAVSTAVQEYNQAGIAVILDMHETYWSPAWNRGNSKGVAGQCQGTGAPLWMYPNAGKLSIDQAMCDFYDNVPEPGVPENPVDGLVAVEQYLASYFGPGNELTHGQVIAFDMLNEPKPVYGTSCQSQVGADMLSIYQTIGTAIRSVDPPVALIYEDYAFQAYERVGFMLNSPLEMSNAIVSGHAYPATWNEQVPSGCTAAEAHQGMPYYLAHVQQAQSFHQPLWIGEFNGFATSVSCTDANWQSDLTANIDFDNANDVNWSFWNYTSLSANLQILPYLEAGISAATPTLAITGPAPGSTVAGTITVSGTVNDVNPVSSVQVSIGGGPPQSPIGTNNWTAQLSTSALQLGPQTIDVSTTDAAGNVATTSETVTLSTGPAPPSNNNPPVVTGNTVDGAILTAAPGTWSSADSLTYTYQWQRCDQTGANCNSLGAAATGDAYTLTSDDVGHQVTVVVSATDPDSQSTGASAAPVGPVSRPSPPVDTTPPVVTGNTAEGAILTATPGIWSSPDSLTYSYQWLLCDQTGANCNGLGAGATGDTYALTSNDLGQQLSVVVTATDAESQSTSAPATPVGPVTSPPPPIPSVTAVAPKAGPVTGHTRITVTGTGFTSGATVDISQGSGAGSTAIPAGNVQVISTTKLKATAGAAAKPGAYQVFVTTSAGTSQASHSDSYTYTRVLPAITSISPKRGPVTGGQHLTITGSGFTPGATVTIRQGKRPAIAAEDVTVVSSKEITAVTGGGAKAGTYPVTVRTASGASAATPADKYTYTATTQSSISSSSPATLVLTALADCKVLLIHMPREMFSSVFAEIRTRPESVRR